MKINVPYRLTDPQKFMSLEVDGEYIKAQIDELFDGVYTPREIVARDDYSNVAIVGESWCGFAISDGVWDCFTPVSEIPLSMIPVKKVHEWEPVGTMELAKLREEHGISDVNTPDDIPEHAAPEEPQTITGKFDTDSFSLATVKAITSILPNPAMDNLPTVEVLPHTVQDSEILDLLFGYLPKQIAITTEAGTFTVPLTGTGEEVKAVLVKAIQRRELIRKYRHIADSAEANVRAIVADVFKEV